MPELPEVETMVRGIRPHTEGRRILRLEFCRCTRKPISAYPSRATITRRTRGHLVEQVSRLAKRVVFRLSSTDLIVVEPRMTGLLLVSEPPTQDHRRIRWHLEPTGDLPDSVQFWDRRGLGTISLFTSAEFRRLESRLGHDALKLTPRILESLLQRTRREIKVALLDQSLIAGIGNLYASEILHLARISPFQPANTLDAEQVRSLNKATRRILNRAIRYEGSTLGDGTYRNALNQDGSYQNQHRVYQHAGEPCPSCRLQDIQRVVQAQRSTFFCPQCQT
jgi:formamidopyrimidine-DNA glycosylase